MRSIEAIFVRSGEGVGSSDWVEYAYLAQGAVRSEIRPWGPTPGRRRECGLATGREWRSRQEFQAMEVLTDTQGGELIQKRSSPSRCEVGARLRESQEAPTTTVYG